MVGKEFMNGWKGVNRFLSMVRKELLVNHWLERNYLLITGWKGLNQWLERSKSIVGKE